MGGYSNQEPVQTAICSRLVKFALHAKEEGTLQIIPAGWGSAAAGQKPVHSSQVYITQCLHDWLDICRRRWIHPCGELPMRSLTSCVDECVTYSSRFT